MPGGPAALNEPLSRLAASSELLRGQDLPAIWAGEEITALDHLGQVRSWPDLLDRLARAVLPAHVVPLGLERQPFAALPRDAVAAVAARALLEPERKGRLTDAVRRAAGFERRPPRDFVVVEAHIDATAVDAPLVSRLLALGFETDNFFRIQPPQYKHHFTSQLVLDRARRQGSRRHREILRDSDRASALLDAFDGGYGYVETEWYKGDTARGYDYRALSPEEAAAFPFDASTFRSAAVPTTEDEARRAGVALGQKRAADIHVKVPGHLARPGYGDADAESARALQRCLLGCGFYEIISEGGNILYSAHFGSMREARWAFARLDGFARRHGGIAGLYCEACTRLWRKRIPAPRDGATAVALAEVPPHLYFREAPPPGAPHADG
jgi:hypothetical protein